MTYNHNTLIYQKKKTFERMNKKKTRNKANKKTKEKKLLEKFF